MKIYTSLIYYLRSIPTLLFGFKDLKEVFFSTLYKSGIVGLKNDYMFHTGGIIDIWAIKEVIFDDCYKVGNKKGKVAIDIGSGIGDFSVLASKKFSKVYAFELDKKRFEMSKKNFKKNNITNVYPLQKEVISLSNIFKSQKITFCDFLKIDCEGAEYKIFKNTSDVILRRVKSFSMEVHFFEENHIYQYKKLKERLKKLGFKVIEKDNPVHSYIAFIFAER